MLRQVPVLLAALAAFSSACSGGSAGPCATAEGIEVCDTELVAEGAYAVGEMRWTLVDESRVTRANGEFPELPSRTLETLVWYPATEAGEDVPAAEGPFPILVWSHGFSSTNTEASWLAPHLASRGYIVAAPRFPLTNLNTDGGPNVADVVEQPADWSFVLDAVIAAGDDASSPLSAAVDGERVMAGGLSLGGMTTLLVTYHATLRDPRVDAAVALAPAAAGFTEVFYETTDTPLLIIFGDSDAILSYEQHATPMLDRVQSPFGLVTFTDGTHTGFAGYARLFEDLEHADEIGCAVVVGDVEEPPSDEEPQTIPGLGGEEVGVVAYTSERLCGGELGIGMRPSRQFELGRMVVAAWADAQLGPVEGRAANQRWLERSLGTIAPAEVQVEWR